MTTHELRVDGMSCGHCVKTVERALRGVAGVTETQVQVGRASVVTDASVTKAALIAALAAVDYAAS